MKKMKLSQKEWYWQKYHIKGTGISHGVESASNMFEVDPNLERSMIICQGLGKMLACKKAGTIQTVLKIFTNKAL